MDAMAIARSPNSCAARPAGLSTTSVSSGSGGKSEAIDPVNRLPAERFRRNNRSEAGFGSTADHASTCALNGPLGYKPPPPEVFIPACPTRPTLH